MRFEDTIEAIGKGIEAIGIIAMILGAAIATGSFLRCIHRGVASSEAYRRYRGGLGRSIILGLEFLVAGDIIRTVGVDPTFRALGVLAGIVLIRTFLSITLELEIENRWPWQRRARHAG